jgi:FkbM family methyltransferase
MKYVYIDLGAYDGDSLDYFLNRNDLPTCTCDFDIYAFEPNPYLDTYWKAITKSNKKIIYSPKAAYIDNEEREFTVDLSENAFGSTLMQSKRNWGVGEIVSVQCFDFSEWMKQFADDYVVVKMDIEGAEFPILEKMIGDGTDRIIDELLCEFHPNKVTEFTTDYKDNLISRLRCGKVIEWH